MDTDLNHITLTGVLERDTITHFADHGTQHVHFTLRLTEPGAAGQAFKLYVAIEAYSQVAEMAGDLNAGNAVLVDAMPGFVPIRAFYVVTVTREESSRCLMLS